MNQIDIFDHIGPGGYTDAMLAAALAAASPDNEVTLRISSPGGDAFTGLAMASLIRQHGGVHATALGLVASAATFPLFAAKKVSMARESTLMLHSPYAGEVQAGFRADELRSTADILDKLQAQIETLYAARSGKSVEDVRAWVGSTEKWFSADEALAANLIDEISLAGVIPINSRWSFRGAPAALAAQLDPVPAMSAEITRLKAELAAAIAKPQAIQVRSDVHLASNRPEPVDALTAHKQRIKALRTLS